MFEKITKYFANRAADNAVEGVKSSFNEKVSEYGDIIKIGLVLSVIVLGGKHITRHSRRDSYGPNSMYIPGSTQPIVINNYYPPYREREERRNRNNVNSYIQQAGQGYQKCKDRR